MKIQSKKQSSNADEYAWYYFCIIKDGPEMYVKTMDKLCLYTSTHFKNGSDVK